MSKEEYHNDISMFGKPILDRLKKLKIFLYGASPLAAEIAKNITLFSIESLTIYDKHPITFGDLGGCTYANEADAQAALPRTEVLLRWLKFLSESIQIDICESFSVQQSLHNIDLFILCELVDKPTMIAINEACRAKNIGFILATNMGLYCNIFVDFGKGHKVIDRDGEDTFPFLIQSITKSTPGVVHLVNQQKHPFQTGDFIRITAVDGMYQVNGAEPRPVKVIDDYSFSIEDTSYFSAYTKGGFAEQVKIPAKISFLSLDHALNSNKPPLANPNYKHVKLLHLFWRSIIETASSGLPELLCEESYARVLRAAKEINEIAKEKTPDFYVENIDEDLFKSLCIYAKVQLAPLAIGWAGLVAKEVLSFCGKFQPIQQLFHLDYFELQPKDKTLTIDAETLQQFKQTRYFHQAALIGPQAQKKLFESRIGIMGAGSNGCELARNLLLMGACCGENGLLDVLDNDTFKQFNVHSHQWIRETSVDKSKVEVLQMNVKNLNPAVKFRATMKLADKSSENELGEDYWQNMDVIFNCTDKKAAKAYLLEKAIWYEKFLIDQSLDAMKGMTHSVVPSISEVPDLSNDDFISGRFEVDKDTIMNHPYLHKHDIIWAKEIFEQLFVENLREIKQYLGHPQKYIHRNQSLFKLNMNYQTKLFIIHALITTKQKLDLKDIVQLAKELFDLYFNEKIYRLITGHLPAENPDDEKYWIGYKKIPSIIPYQTENRMIVRFIMIATGLFVNLLGLVVPSVTEDSVKKHLLASYGNDPTKHTQYWQLSSYELKDEKDIENFETILDECAKPAFLPELKIQVSNTQATSEHFHDSYIEFLEVAANLRSQCYDHGRIQKFKVENIAFEMNRRSLFPQSIITSMAVLELYKFAMEKDIEDYRNIRFDLTKNQFDFIQPDKAITFPKQPNAVHFPKPFNVWEKIVIEKVTTVEGLIEQYKQQYDINITSVYVNNVQVWQSNPLESKDDFHLMKMDLIQAYEHESGASAPQGITQFLIILTAKNRKDEAVIFPPIKYIHSRAP